MCLTVRETNAHSEHMWDLCGARCPAVSLKARSKGQMTPMPPIHPCIALATDAALPPPTFQALSMFPPTPNSLFLLGAPETLWIAACFCPEPPSARAGKLSRRGAAQGFWPASRTVAMETGMSTAPCVLPVTIGWGLLKTERERAREREKDSYFIAPSPSLVLSSISVSPYISSPRARCFFFCSPPGFSLSLSLPPTSLCPSLTQINSHAHTHIRYITHFRWELVRGEYEIREFPSG